MSKLALVVLFNVFIFKSCKIGFNIINTLTVGHNLSNINPKEGIIEVPSMGQTKLWEDIEHSRFSVVLINSSSKFNCEIYSVDAMGTEKLKNVTNTKNRNITVIIPVKGYLLVKNTNSEKLIINYKLKE